GALRSVVMSRVFIPVEGIRPGRAGRLGLEVDDDVGRVTVSDHGQARGAQFVARDRAEFAGEGLRAVGAIEQNVPGSRRGVLRQRNGHAEVIAQLDGFCGGGHVGVPSLTRGVWGTARLPPLLPRPGVAGGGTRNAPPPVWGWGMGSRSGLSVGAAHGPRADALGVQDALGDDDLLLAGGLGGGGGELAAAVTGPGLRVELQTAVVAVAGAGAPVTSGLALRHGVPVDALRGFGDWR